MNRNRTKWLRLSGVWSFLVPVSAFLLLPVFYYLYLVDQSPSSQNLTELLLVTLCCAIGALGLVVWLFRLWFLTPLRALIEELKMWDRPSLSYRHRTFAVPEISDLTDAIEHLQLKMRRERVDSEALLRKKLDEQSGHLMNVVQNLQLVRSPLQMAQSYASLYRRATPQEFPRPEVAQSLTRMLDQSQKMLHDLMDLVRLEEELMSFEHKVFDLPTVLDDLYRSVQEDAAQHHVDFTIELDDVPEQLVGDQHYLMQALVHLIHSSLDVFVEGTLRLRLEQLPSMADAPRLAFTLTEEPLDRIAGYLLTPEDQTGVYSSLESQGVGLAIAKRIVERMGGVFLQSKQSESGRLFRLEIPFQWVGQTTQEFSSAMDILVVEDNPMSQKLVQTMIRQIGLVADVCGNAAEAIQKMQQKPYALLLTDIVLPDQDGYQLINQLRSKGFHLPVLVMTAGDMAEHEELCRKNGVNDWMPKPLRIDVLAEKLLSWHPSAGMSQLAMKESSGRSS